MKRAVGLGALVVVGGLATLKPSPTRKSRRS